MALRFIVTGIGDIEDYIVLTAADMLKSAFSTVVDYVLMQNRVPSGIYNPRRSQYRADMVNIWLYSKFAKYLDQDTYLVAIVGFDAYVPGLNFVFGLATPSLRVASVYTPRLYFMISGSDRDVLLSRIRKEVMHEVGHLLGLNHCSNPLCVMRFSNSILDTDNKTWKYCVSCAKKLADLGIKVSSDFILS